MQIIDYNTRLFKNIFPDYDTFSNWYMSTGFAESIDKCPSKVTFQLIFNEYSCSHASMSPDDFKGHFANDLYTYFQEFEATTLAISELMDLTDKDIEIADSMVNNVANVPETAASTDNVTTDFLSSQNKQITLKGKLQIKRELLSNKRAFTVRSFLAKFKHLFIKVISPAYTYVVEEPDED